MEWTQARRQLAHARVDSGRFIIAHPGHHPGSNETREAKDRLSAAIVAIQERGAEALYYQAASTLAELVKCRNDSGLNESEALFGSMLEAESLRPKRTRHRSPTTFQTTWFHLWGRNLSIPNKSMEVQSWLKRLTDGRCISETDERRCSQPVRPGPAGFAPALSMHSTPSAICTDAYGAPPRTTLAPRNRCMYRIR